MKRTAFTFQLAWAQFFWNLMKLIGEIDEVQNELNLTSGVEGLSQVNIDLHFILPSFEITETFQQNHNFLFVVFERKGRI